MRMYIFVVFQLHNILRCVISVSIAWLQISDTKVFVSHVQNDLFFKEKNI